MKSLDDRVSPEIKAITDPAPAPAEAPKPQASRQGKKSVLVPLDPDAHKQLRYLSFETGQTMEQIAREAILDRLQKASKLTS